MTKFSEFADVRFSAAEFAEGEPFITTLENGPKTNTILDDKTDFLLILKAGTTPHQAERLVHELNAHVKQIGLQRR
ncbi:hypothetical protein [Occallatibacter savannae]|uniref:hypothetical protein n=1 Tax=Occallatibacter savannae TaxID=1002691 RepID=UPI000D687C00|nr:hypothetical protein [Occallatibacter savannae]